MLEQTVHGLLVAAALWASFQHTRAAGPLRLHDGVLLLAAAAGQVVAQKQRSFASRQAEKDRAAGVAASRLACSRAQARWAAAGQVVSVLFGVATAATWAHVPLALWAALFPVWRRWYRSWYPAGAEL